MTKYDYTALKQEFYSSDHVDLTPFLREKGILAAGADLGQIGGNVRENFKGWADDKKNWLQAQFDKACEVAAEKNATEWAKVLENVDEARRNGLIALYDLLSDKDKAAEFAKNPKTLVTTLRHLRLEAGESTDNVNNLNPGVTTEFVLPANGFGAKEPQPETDEK